MLRGLSVTKPGVLLVFARLTTMLPFREQRTGGRDVRCLLCRQDCRECSLPKASGHQKWFPYWSGGKLLAPCSSQIGRIKKQGWHNAPFGQTLASKHYMWDGAAMFIVWPSASHRSLWYTYSTVAPSALRLQSRVKLPCSVVQLAAYVCV